MADKKDTKKDTKKEKGNSAIKKGFDIGTPLGILMGFSLIVVSILQSGGMEGLMGFLDIPSVMIVFGGIIASVLINFTFSDILSGFKVALTTTKTEKYNLELIVDKFEEMSKKARKTGILSLEDDIKNLEDEFLKKGLKLAIDGYDVDEIKNILNQSVSSMQERHSKSQELIDKVGELGPAWGMIGTLVGLVLMLRNLSDPSTLGPAMAVAMLTTMYGAVVANLVAIPILGKLERKSSMEVYVKEMIIDGVCEIQKGQSPIKLRAKLDSYVKKNEKKNDKKKGKKSDKDVKEGEAK